MNFFKKGARMETTKWNIALGVNAQDKVSGFKGVVTSRVEYLNGCKKVCLQPKVDKDGKHPDGIFFDEEQVEVVSKQVVEPSKAQTGGPVHDLPPIY